MASIISQTAKAGMILFCGFIILSAENLLTNNSFEDGSLGWQQWGAVSTTQCYVGAKAMEVTNSSAQWSGISQEVPILEDVETITVSGWMKTDNVAAGKKNWEKATISVEFMDENGTSFENYPGQVALAEGTQDWTYYEKTYRVYSGAKKINIVAALGNATGSAAFDQFTLHQKKTDGTTVVQKELQEYFVEKQKSLTNSYSFLKNGSFENAQADWESYNVNFPSSGRDGSSVLKIDNANFQWSGASQIVSLPKEASSIVVEGWMKCDKVIRGKEGWDKAIISFEFLDSEGVKVGEYPHSIAEAEGTSEWKYYQRRYAVTPNSSQIKLFCQLCNAKGEVMFDDIAVVLFNSAGEEIKF